MRFATASRACLKSAGKSLKEIETDQSVHLWRLQQADRALVKRTGINPVDVRFPSRLFPLARRLKRRVFLHIGPTNSGKSYSALRAFKEAKSGFYGGPLRMLAREIFDKMEAQNIPCNLVTGDEIVYKYDENGEAAKRSSGTIEMMSLSTKMDVAIIDEIQMINDPDRGWAWTRAFLGVQAREIHLCGDENCERLLQELVSQTSDILHVKRYSRLAPLRMDHRTIRAPQLLLSLEPGDCIVCFSKRSVKAYRDKIIKKLKKPCAMVYGSLPPEIRAQQARLFNEPGNGVDYIVASDAIGMGLNLRIKRVIFTTLSKFDGENIRYLDIPQIKQIAGRAGRYDPEKQQSEGGLVNCVRLKDKRVIQHALETPSPPVQRAVLMPPKEIIRASALDKGQNFSTVLREVYVKAAIGDFYERPREGSSVAVAMLYDNLNGLTFDDKVVLASAPVAIAPEVQRVFKRMCAVIAQGAITTILDVFPAIERLDIPDILPIDLEITHKVITLYLWLSYRFPCNFTDREGARDLKILCEQRFTSVLSRATISTQKVVGKYHKKVPSENPFDELDDDGRSEQ